MGSLLASGIGKIMKTSSHVAHQFHQQGNAAAQPAYDPQQQAALAQQAAAQQQQAAAAQPQATGDSGTGEATIQSTESVQPPAESGLGIREHLAGLVNDVLGGL